MKITNTNFRHISMTEDSVYTKIFPQTVIWEISIGVSNVAMVTICKQQ